MRPPALLPPISLLSPRTPLLNKTLPIIRCLRCFSASPIARAKGPRRRMVGAEKLSDIPEDIGFLDSMIMPTMKGSNLPAIWKAPKLHYRLIQIRYGMWDMNRTQLKRFAAAHPMHTLVVEDLEKLALMMYKQMNSAFANGSQKDMSKLDKICGQKFGESLKSSIMQREPGEKYKWSWIKEIKKPKLVSFLATPVIKGQPESEIVQAVVRISGEESVEQILSEGTEISEGEKPVATKQDSYTYIALHMKMWIRPNQWQIIGRVQETPVAQIMQLVESRNLDQKMKEEQARSMKPKTLVRRIWDSVRRFGGGGGGARPSVLPPPNARTAAGKR